MADSNNILKKTQELLAAQAAEKEVERTRVERERRELITSLSQNIADIIAPAINNLAQSQQVTFAQMRRMLREIKVEAPRMPEIKIPNINVPQPKVQVNVPDVKVPPITVPETKINFPDRMSVTMDAVDRTAPLPVMMMDGKGKPMTFPSGASGGKADFFTIKDIRDSSGASIINNDGKLKVDATVSASISQDYGSGEIGSQTVRMVMATDAIASVNVVAGSTSGTEYNDGDTASTPTGAVAMGDTGEESGNIYAVALGGGVVGSSVLRIVHATDVGTSVNAIGGTIDAVTAVTDITNSVATYQLDAEGNYRSTFPIEGNITTVTAVTDITNSIAANLVDSTGVAYTTSNPLPIDDAGGSLTVDGTVTVSSITATTASNIVDSSGVAYSGSNPVPVSGQVTAVPINVRGSRATAYATISSDAATTLLAGVASTYLDMVYVMGANQSDGAVTLDFYTGSGGATMLSLEIPANSTAGVAPATAIPMTEAAQAWYMYYADSDVTGTTVDVTALFSKET